MEGIITYQSYSEYKAQLDTELSKSAEGFVRIGWLLKQARDTDILKESGYANVNEFARQEYNIDKTMVSRFIGINDRFSEGGNSPQLKEQYRNFGYSKLAVMLQLPESINEELSPAFTRTEILAVKEEYDAELEKTDLEVLMEEKPEGQQDMEDDLSKAIWQLGHDNPELYQETYRASVRADGGCKALQEALAPAGEGIYSIRIPGTGRMLLSVKGTDSDLTLTNIRTGEKERYSWDSLHRAVCGIISLDALTPEGSWEKIYGEPFPVKKEPEKPKVAPVQPKKEDKKPLQRKQPKVIKAKTPEKPVTTQWEGPEKEEIKGRAEEKMEEGAVTETERETEPSSHEACHDTETIRNDTGSTGNDTGAIENVTGISEIVTEASETVTETPPSDTAQDKEQESGTEEPACLKEPQITREEFLARRKKYINWIMMELSMAKESMEEGEYSLTRIKMKRCVEWIDSLEELDRENPQYLPVPEEVSEKEDKEDADEQ